MGLIQNLRGDRDRMHEACRCMLHMTHIGLVPSVDYGRPIGKAIIFCRSVFFFFLPLSSSFFFPSPILSGRRLDVHHISTHDVALVRI